MPTVTNASRIALVWAMWLSYLAVPGVWAAERYTGIGLQQQSVDVTRISHTSVGVSGFIGLGWHRVSV